MTTISTAPQRGVLASFALLLISMMLSGQASAFDVGGFRYVVIDGTTNVAVTGRAPGNNAKEIVIPDTTVDGTTRYSVTTIGRGAFDNNALTSVIIPDSVTTIGEYAFYENALTSVTIPDSVTTIGNEAFARNNNASDTPPFGGPTLNSAAFLGNFGTFNLNMFRGSFNLATITYAQGATGWNSPQRIFTPDTGQTGSVTATPAAAPAPATPVPTSPLWLLGMMAGLLSLVGIRKLRKA